MNSIQQLIRKIEEKEEAYFQRIAEFLLKTYYVNINGDRYDLMDIELYYKGPKTDDKHTHYHEFPHGLFRAHAAGIDLTLRESKEYFGGVLIKGILINGKVLNKNFDVNYKIVESLQKEGDGVKWIKKDSPLDTSIISTHRENLGKSDDSTKNEPWRFVLKDKRFIKVMSGKEDFVRSNPEHFKNEIIEDYLGYNIQL